MLRPAVVLATALAASAAFAAEPAPELVAEVQARPYVSGFCGLVALNDSDPAALSQLLSAWQARAASSGADAMLQDASVAGQEFQFAAENAPRAIIERRRGTCNLIYRSAAAPLGVTTEFRMVQLPVGERDALRPWRRVTTRRAGPPGPIRYFVNVGEDPSLGLCATIFEDLRQRDNTPATLVKVATCRLGGDETLDNG